MDTGFVRAVLWVLSDLSSVSRVHGPHPLYGGVGSLPPNGGQGRRELNRGGGTVMLRIRLSRALPPKSPSWVILVWI